MSRKGPRPIVFVCSAVLDTKLVSHTITAALSTEAASLFETTYKVKPESIHGPFYHKRIGVLDNTRNIQFNGQSEVTTYNGWIVNALHLKDPENCAYLLFNHRADNKKMPKPIGTFIVKLDDLRTQRC